MTTKQTYIYSDAECIIKAMVHHPGTFEEFKEKWPTGTYEEYIEDIEQAKSTAVKFADQEQAYRAICGDAINSLYPNTIYTVEVYEFFEEFGPCPEFKLLATLKRINPVVEYDNQDEYFNDVAGIVQGLANFELYDDVLEKLKVKYTITKNTPKQ